MKRDISGDIVKVEDKDGFLDFIKDIKDHRIERKKLHSVAEIIFLAFCGCLSNCNSWEDIKLFGKGKLEFLRRFLRMKMVYQVMIR